MIESAYATLRLTRDASPEEVRKAYVHLVRRYPPEHFPEKFASIRRAYQQLTLDDDFVEDVFRRIGDESTLLEVAGWLWGDRKELGPDGDFDLTTLTSLLVGEDVKQDLNALLAIAASEPIEWKVG
jgi:curved DNA-binding protein CbpA